MDAFALLLFIPAAALVAMTPGSNNLLALSNGSRIGPLQAVLAVGGRIMAFVILLGLVVIGLGSLLEQSELAFQIVKWVGVAYLAFLGIKLWRSGPGAEEGKKLPRNLRKLVRQEFLVAITNPKALLLFSAFLPQFVQPGGDTTLQLAELGAVYLVVELGAAVVYAGIGWLIGEFSATAAGRVRLNKISGTMMLGAAGLLATARRGS